MTHLWEVDHPYYAPDSYANKCESFEHLRHDVDRIDEDMNLIYRWDWVDPRHPSQDDLYLSDEYRSPIDTLTIWMLQPRKSQFISFSCPVTHEQEAEVLEWLRGPRVAGHLRKLWAPVLDEVTP